MDENIGVAIRSIATLDIICLTLMLIFVVRCTLIGFVKEVFSMAAVILGILAGIFFYNKGAIFIRTKVLENVRFLPEIAAFVALFCIVFVVMKILQHILGDIVEQVHLGGFDRFLGLIFGFVEGTLIIVLVLFVISIQPLFDPEPVLRGSVFAEFFMPLIRQNISLMGFLLFPVLEAA
jgi:membrane protein required for colicin V production